MRKGILIATVAVMLLGCFVFTGCRESSRVNYNVSKDADNFNVMRRLAVINTVNGAPVFEMVCRFAIEADTERPNYVMAPEEFKKEAIKIQNIKEYQFGDKHRIADDLMEELLESLGYEAGLNIIRKLPRYYT